jgi:1-deoxy-D-xylulose-5-phosphate reductoisomerase
LKRIVILGSTGSIGSKVADVCARNPDDFKVVGLAARSNITRLIEQVRQFSPKYVHLYDEKAMAALLTSAGLTDIETFVGTSGLNDIATVPDADVVVLSLPGFVGLAPTLAAIRSGKSIIDSNKEALAVAGQFIMEEVQKTGVTFLPLDGEHLGIIQCLAGSGRKTVKRIILTASGGPFRDVLRMEDLQNVTVADTLKHPNWSMGPKISVDSATLMNKGLEIIVAHHLFGLAFNEISTLIHRESYVHALVEFIDGSILAQLSMRDIRIAAGYALYFPNRKALGFDRLDLAKHGKLTFAEPRIDLFPCLRLALMAGEEGGLSPAVLNASNEIAVENFLTGRIRFTDIPVIVELTLDRAPRANLTRIEDLVHADQEARWIARDIIDRL